WRSRHRTGDRQSRAVGSGRCSSNRFGRGTAPPGCGRPRSRSQQHTELMRRVDYDDVAQTYNRRYERNKSEGVRAALHEFLGDAGNLDVAEIGCGTGHWLADVAGLVRSEIGIDPSWEMLRRAAVDARTALLIRARAEDLPLAAASLDRVFCVNALQHFADK